MHIWGLLHYGSEPFANVAHISTEHFVKHVRTSFGVFGFVTLNNTFPVHHSMTTCTHIIRPTFDLWVKRRNSTFYWHNSLSLIWQTFKQKAFRFLCKISSGVSEALLHSLCSLSSSCLCTVRLSISEALLDSLHSLSCSFLCTVCSRVSVALVVYFCNLPFFTLSNVCSHVSCALVHSSHTLSCSFLANFSCSDSKVLLRFIASFLAVHCAFLFDGKACPHP